MKKYTSNATTIASNPWFVIIASASSIGGFFWYIHDRITEYPPVLSGIYYSLSLIILFGGVLYSLSIRTENLALRKIAATFNEINHLYRDSLKSMFGGNNPVCNTEDLLSEEEQVLRSVCQRIENIFIQVTGRECMVTLKLVIKNDNGKYYAHTYVRSLENCVRDKPERKKYEVGTGANTAFDHSIQKRPDGSPSHYYSPDLTKEENYSNERQHYSKLYRSSIVVPIRGVNKGKEGTDEEYDMIGYLCVDTKSTHRLNEGYHLQMMSSLAGQMYNFMSLMRGKYTVFVG